MCVCVLVCVKLGINQRTYNMDVITHTRAIRCVVIVAEYRDKGATAYSNLK